MENPFNKSFNLEEFFKSFSTLKIKISEDKHILTISFNRPKELNALNEIIFIEIGKIFGSIDKILEKVDIRVIILKGEGKAFSAGLDLKSKIPELIMQLKSNEDLDVSRKAYYLYSFVRQMQENLAKIENCPLPVIASIHGYCLGGGMSITSFCDFRLTEKSAVFSIKEVDIGLTADIGFIQKIIKQTGREGLMRKLTFTGEKFLGDKALQYNIVDECYSNKEELEKETLRIAEEMAQKSPMVLWGIKRMFNFARENSLSASLDMVATMNSGLIQGDDMIESITAFLTKRNAKYAKI